METTGTADTEKAAETDNMAKTAEKANMAKAAEKADVVKTDEKADAVGVAYLSFIRIISLPPALILPSSLPSVEPIA